MAGSNSTDKLAIVGAIVDKMLDKLPSDKITKIKELNIEWEEFTDYDNDCIYLPNLSIKFHE